MIFPAKKVLTYFAILIVCVSAWRLFAVIYLPVTSGIAGTSMIPNLYNGQEYSKLHSTPADVRAGDIIAFSTVNQKTGERKALVKRVVAVKNDIVKVADGVISVDGVEFTHDPIYKISVRLFNTAKNIKIPFTFHIVRECNHIGRCYAIFTTLEKSMPKPKEINFEGSVQNTFFVMGDNRFLSSNSITHARDGLSEKFTYPKVYEQNDPKEFKIDTKLLKSDIESMLREFDIMKSHIEVQSITIEPINGDGSYLT